ncbi:CHASE2 domain-containing protein [Cupriavidus necator]
MEKTVCQLGEPVKRLVTRWIVSGMVLLVLLGHAGGYYRLLFIDSIDNLIYDTRLRLTMPATVDERIVIVDIDEQSLAKIGRWPWGRDTMATLVEKLVDRSEVALIGFDIVMAEPDNSSGLKLLEQLARGALQHDERFLGALSGLRTQLDFDGRFAAALIGRRAVLAYYFTHAGVSSGALPSPVLRAADFAGQVNELGGWGTYTGNLPLFQGAAAAAGFFNIVVDFDGTVRRVPMIVAHAGHIYESLSLAITRLLMGKPEVRLGFGGGEVSAIQSLELHTSHGILRFPVDRQGTMLIPYRGTVGSFPYVSAVDVLDDRVPHNQLAGRIVLVGTTVPGLLDMRSTPVGNIFPGVEIHANLISGMLDGRLKRELADASTVQLLVVLLTGLSMTVCFPWHSPLRATVASVSLLGLVVGGNFALWHYGNLALPLAAIAVMIVVLFGLNMSLGYFVESRTRQQFATLFGQYVPPELVAQMSRQPQLYSMDSRRAELTVLFSDVRNFTRLSESLEPEQLAQWTNEYLNVMTAIIRDQGGTLDKYIGDAIMAFWGAPVSDQRHAQRAVLSALRMRAALPTLNSMLEARGLPTIEIGIGINTGQMTVGDMGSAVRKAYTVMGDEVNLGARLEGVTKHYGVPIVIGELTQRQTEHIVYRELDYVRVKGRLKQIAIYEPVGEAATVQPQLLAEIDSWHEALRCYRARNWQTAETLLRQLLVTRPNSRLYTLFLDRLDQLRLLPQEAAWDGVYEFDTK